MTKDYTAALSLLKSAIWNGTDNNRNFLDNVELPTIEEEWLDIIDFFKRQTLNGLLPDAISLLQTDRQPQIETKMRIIYRQVQVERKNSNINKELIDFTSELNKRDIPYFMLKGQGAGKLYPVPSHRTPGDIDLYVPEEYIKYTAIGFKAFGATRIAETRHHINYRVNEVDWELHHHIYYFQKEKRNRIFMQYVEKAIQTPPHYETIDGGKVRVMPPTLNVVTLLAHILDHFYCEGVGLRQLCDYALTLHHKLNEIDRTEFLEILKELSLTRSYRIFGYLCIYYLGLPKEDLLLEPNKKEKRLAHKVMDDCLKGGNFGYADSNSRSTFCENVTFYTRFLRRLWQFRNLCPSEALWWPIAKLQRTFKGEVNISEEKSAANI